MIHARFPSKWITTTLGECCDIVSGGTPRRECPEFWDGTVPWVTPKDISDIDNPIFVDPPERITELGLRRSSATLLPKGAVLFSSRAPIGLVAIAGQPMATNQGFKSLVPRSCLDSGFLYYAIKRKVPEIAARGNGATFKEVSKSVMSEIQIAFPKKIDDQRRIAAVLEKADGLRRKRLEGNRLASEMMCSIFLDLFGDPVSNPRRWPERSVESICTKITDGTHDTPPRQSHGYKFITGKNIRAFEIDLTDLEFVSKEIHKEIYRRCNPTKGDVLYTNIGAKAGTAAFNNLDEQFSMKNVALLKPDPSCVTGRYLEYVLNHPGFKQQTLSRFGLGGAQGFLGLGGIKQIIVPTPPIKEQEKFILSLDVIFKIQSRVRLDTENAEKIFSSLSQRAFCGDL